MRFDLKSFNAGASLIDQANAERRAQEAADWEKQRREREAADFARQEEERKIAAETLGKAGTVTGGAVSGEAALSAGTGAMEGAIARAATEEERGAVREAFAPTVQALTAQRGVQEQPGTTYTREQAQGDFLRQMQGVNPAKAMQFEDSMMRLDEGRDKAARREAFRTVDSKLREFVGNQIPKGEDGAPVLDNDAMVRIGKMRSFLMSQHGQYDEAMRTAQETMQHAAAKISLEEKERQVAVKNAADALRMSGDFKPAMDVYRKYIPDGAEGLTMTPQKDGSILMTRKSSVDGAPLPPQKFKDINHLVAVVEGMADSKRVTDYVDQTFRHDIESRRLGIESKRLTISENADSRAEKKDTREQVKLDAIAKANADYADAEAKGDAAAMSAARRTILLNGGKLEKPEIGKPDVKVGNMGDITVSQPTGRGGVEVTNYGPDMKPKGKVSIPAPGAAAAGTRAGEEKVIQAGPNKGKVAVYDGKGWVLK